MRFRLTPRTFLVVGLLAALLVAGVASYYASSHPDGLSAVAETTGFVDHGRASATSHGPFAGYETRGIADDRLSHGVAGIAGALLVLFVGGGLFRLLRRRSPGDDPGEA